MDKEEYKRERERVFSEQKQFLRDNPEVGRLVKTKKIFKWFLAGYLTVHFFLSIGIMIIQDSLTAGMAGIEIVKLFFHLLWICLFLNHAGIWKQNLMLYLSAGYNFYTLLQNRAIMQSVWTDLPYMELAPSVMYRGIMVMEVLLPFILLAMASWLILPRRNRELAEEASAMYLETLQDLQNRFR